MKIERMTVEGGFLDGLDISFSAGMNVLIGGRGTGKTSIIELLRYCLNARSYTEVSTSRSLEHALAVLQDGQVTVTISNGENTVTISRTADSPPTVRANFPIPIIFSQSDIESLGTEASGRLRLIDSFRTRQTERDVNDEKLVASVQSLTSEMLQLTNEVESIEAQLHGKEDMEKQLREITEREEAFAARSKNAQKRQVDLQQINHKLSALVVGSEVIARTVGLLEKYAKDLDLISTFRPSIEKWPREAGEIDRLMPIRGAFDQALKGIEGVVRQVGSTIEVAKSLMSTVDNEKIPLEKFAREIRKHIEQLEEGAGATSRAASQIRGRLAQLQALVSLRDQRLARIANIQAKRGAELDELDSNWERRFKDRDIVAGRLNSQLSPKIRVQPIRAAQLAPYASALAAALRGSGLRYNELSVAIATRMSPRELVEMVEKGDSTTLAELLDIQYDRGARLIAHLRDHGTTNILTAHVEDDIKMELLDGAEYKNIEHLSMGQRCTVILPIVLEHRDRVLVLDQPEDHLDNAFVVETVVKAILNRGPEAQLLVSTHNANLPVLGNAAQVIVMGSDGKRGFVDRIGDLEDKVIVQAITRIMEGGAEAFESRARFYKSRLGSNG